MFSCFFPFFVSFISSGSPHLNCDIIQTPCNIESLLCKVFVYMTRIHAHTWSTLNRIGCRFVQASGGLLRSTLVSTFYVFFSLNWLLHIVSMETEVRRSSQGMTLGCGIGPGVQGFQNGGLCVQWMCLHFCPCEWEYHWTSVYTYVSLCTQFRAWTHFVRVVFVFRLTFRACVRVVSFDVRLCVYTYACTLFRMLALSKGSSITSSG